MKKHRLSTVVCSVDPNLFQDNTGDHFRTTVGNAYSACAYGCALEICRNAKKYGVGPVSLVLESGQPNVGCVEKVLMELIGDPEFDISLVSVVKKEDFIQLHVPDFISHICSTKDPWFQCLEDSDDVLHIPISASILEKTSRDIKLLVENNKAKRRRIKRMEKSGQ